MTSLDSNVVFSAINPYDANHQRALEALDRHAARGFCICPVVRAELRASADWRLIEEWLIAQAVQTQWLMPPAVWDAAGAAFSSYTQLRLKNTLPRRIVGDFLIAAHAEHHALEVLTFDTAVYKAVFASLTLLDC